MNALPILLTLAGIILLAYTLYRVHMKRLAARERKRQAERDQQAKLDAEARLGRVMHTVQKNKIRQAIASAPADPDFARKARERLEQRIPPPPRPTGHSSSNLAYTDRPRPSVNNPPDDYRYIDNAGLSPAFLHGIPSAPPITTIDADTRCSSNDSASYNHTSDYSPSDCGSSSFSSD